MIYDQLGSFLLLNTYGAVVVVIYSSDDKYTYQIYLKNIFFSSFITKLLSKLIHAENENIIDIDITYNNAIFEENILFNII